MSYNKLRLCFALLLLVNTWFEFSSRFPVASKSASYLGRIRMYRLGYHWRDFRWIWY